MTKASEKIQALEERLKRLKAQAAQAEARAKAAAKKRARADETRKKILLGSMLLHQLSAGQINPQQLRSQLSNYLSRPDDRALFSLDPLPTAHAQDASN